MVNNVSALTAYRALCENLAEMNIKYTVRITRLLELRCDERDRPLNFVMDRTNLRSHL